MSDDIPILTLPAEDQYGMVRMDVSDKHTVLFDLRVIKQRAIADFVAKQSVDYQKHSGLAIQEDIALAIGWFDVPLSMLYDDDFKISQLSDEALAQIVRYRMLRAEGEPDNEH